MVMTVQKDNGADISHPFDECGCVALDVGLANQFRGSCSPYFIDIEIF